MPAPRVVLDRPVRLTARGAHPGPANPFERANYDVPLLLVIHIGSVEALSGLARAEAELLVSLGYSPYADIWFTWGDQTFGPGFGEARLGAGLSDENEVLPVEVSYDGGKSWLRTGVRMWWEWQHRARERYDVRYTNALSTLTPERG